jgi:outer membrane protein OmpA-like peptidoglycan-associated protein
MSNCKFNYINSIHALLVFVVLLLSGCINKGMNNVRAEVEENTPQSSALPKDVVNKQTQYFDPKVHYIYFNKKETRFNDSYASELLIVFDELKKFKNSCVEIYGYDSIDKDYKSSKKLAVQRAEWTKRCLLGEGVDVQYIKIVQGMEPVKLPKKAPAADIRQSRRVEVHVLPCDDAEFKLKNKSPNIDQDNPFKYK